MLLEVCESRLVVNLQCTGLRIREVIGRADPFAVIYLDSRVPRAGYLTGAPAPPPEIPGGPRDARWELIGRSETRHGTTSPVFAKSFEIPYFFERAQRLAIDIYFRDDARDDPLVLHRFVGSVDLKLPSLARQHRLNLALSDPGRPKVGCGTITVIGEDGSGSKHVMSMKVALQGLRPRWTRWLVRSEPPSLTITREPAGGVGPGCDGTPIANESTNPQRPTGQDWIVVHGPSLARRVPNEATSFDFASIDVNYERLCLSSDLLPLRYELTQGRRDKVIGVASGTLREWRERRKLAVFPDCQREEGRATSAGTTPSSGSSPKRPIGWLVLRDDVVSAQHSFLDYIYGGYEISLILAIDFTASNGDPTQRGTLHFVDQFAWNEYESAIKSVGEILAQYDSDQMFPAYGFGAKLPPDYRFTSHCFPLTGSEDATCVTIDGVLDAYRQTLYNVRPSGPTVFAEIVRAAARHVKDSTSHVAQAYSIFLIVTDGVINDMEETILEIAAASRLPLSIVIVGVGDDDFTEMTRLDSDNVKLHDTAERDIVQFVPFRQYKGAPEVLAAKVLEEIPTQVRGGVRCLRLRNLEFRFCPVYRVAAVGLGRVLVPRICL
jgi:Copine